MLPRRTSAVASSVLLSPAWLVDDADLARLGAEGGVAPRGIHTYAYVHLDDAARAFRLALEIEDVAVAMSPRRPRCRARPDTPVPLA